MTNDSKTTDECYELAATLNDAVEVFYEPFDGHESTRIAAKILAAGYRKPRTITTVEELDSLPVGSILRDSAGKPWHIFINDEGFRIHQGADFTQFPATVLYEPEAEATR